MRAVEAQTVRAARRAIGRRAARRLEMPEADSSRGDARAVRRRQCDDSRQHRGNQATHRGALAP